MEILKISGRKITTKIAITILGLIKVTVKTWVIYLPSSFE